jgi:hypothetical protein
MHFIPNHFQGIVVALGKVVFPGGGFIRDRTITIHYQKCCQFVIVQNPKRNICGHQSITRISEKTPMTYFHLQMNTVAVIFAQISFCSKNALLVYVCRGRYIVVPSIFLLPLLLCHKPCSIKCHRQLKIYHLQTQLQFALNYTIKWFYFRHRDKTNYSSATQN